MSEEKVIHDDLSYQPSTFYFEDIKKQFYQIPIYQRSYSWYKDKALLFFEDLISFWINNLVNLVNSNIDLLKKTDQTININLLFSKNDDLNLSCDYEQISRVIFNLIKNSIESIQEKALKIGDFNKKINIEIKRINNYIAINIFDNGIGFSKKITKENIKPYYTTKQKGSGLGLSIVNKIINDHNGTIEFNSDTTGTNIIVNLPIK